MEMYYKVLLIDNHRRDRVENITAAMRAAPDGVLTKAEVDALRPRTKDWRVEVRYVLDGKKYRAVYYNEDVIVPVYSPEELSESPTPRFSKHYPLSACIGREHDVHGKEGADVTEHVQKYCGPKRNWYLDKDMCIVEHMDHMFISDDPITMKNHYPYLHIRTLGGTTSHRIA